VKVRTYYGQRQPIYQTPLVTKILKGMQNVETGVAWVLRGHSRSLEIAPFDTAYQHIQVPISLPL